jgi:hypothetical protein
MRILYVTAYDVPTAEAIGKILRQPIPLGGGGRHRGGRRWRSIAGTALALRGAVVETLDCGGQVKCYSRKRSARG